MAKKQANNKDQKQSIQDLKIEEIRKKNIEDSNKVLSEQLNLISQIKDKLVFINKTSKEKYTQDELALEAVKKATRLTQNLSSEYDSIKKVQDDIKKNEKLQNEVRRTTMNLEKEIGKEGLKRIQFIKNQEKGLDKSKKLLEELREKEVQGVEGAKDKANILARQIYSRQSSLITQKQNLSVEEKQYDILKETGKTLDVNIAYLDKQLQIQKNLTSTTGETFVKIADGLNKIGAGGIAKFLKFRELGEEMKKFRYQLTEGGTVPLKGFPGLIKRAAIGFKSLGSVISTALGPLSMIAFLIGGIKKLFGFIKKGYQEGLEAAKKVSEENVGLSRSLGLAQGEASKLAGTVRGMGPTQAASVESAKALYSAMGGTEKLSTKTLKTFIGLNTFAGMSAENLASIHKFAKLSGDDSGVVAEHMADAALSAIKNNKLAVSQKVLLGDVAKTSDVIKLRYQGQENELVKIVADAKKYGLELSKAEDIAKSLLNIEDSLAAEMEAELLTGKELNLEKAREAALNGDVATLQAEIAKNAGSIEEFNKMNVVQQEAYAKAVGLSRQDLGKMLSDQKSNLALNGNLVDEQQNGLEAMKSGVSLAEQESEIERAKQAASLGYFKALRPLVLKIQEAVIKVKTVLADWFGDKITKALNDPAVKAFVNDLPKNAEQFAIKLTKAIDKVLDFIGKNPTFSTLGFLFGGKVAGGAIRAAGTMLGNIGSFLGRKIFESKGVIKKPPGSDPNNPSYTKNVNDEMVKDFNQKKKPGLFGRFRKKKEPVEEATDAIKQSAKEQSKAAEKQSNAAVKEQKNFTKKASQDIKKQSTKNTKDITRATRTASRDIKNQTRKASREQSRVSRSLNNNVKKQGREQRKLFRGLNRSMKGMFGGLKRQMSGLFRNLNSAVRRIGKGGGASGLLGMLGPIGMVASIALPAISAIASGDGLGGALEALDPTGMVGAVRDSSGSSMDGGFDGGFDTEMATGGIVNKPTKALIGEAGPEAVIPLREFYAKMDELIAAVKQGGIVTLDGNKVGQALVVGGYKQ